MDDVTDSKVLLREKIVSQDIDQVDDTETDRIDNRSEPEIKFEPEAVQLHEDELTNSTRRPQRDNPDYSVCRSD